MNTVALSIGHSPRDGGAVMADGSQSEYQYWLEHAPKIKRILEQQYGISAVIVNRLVNGGGTTPGHAAAACNATDAILAVELHFNSYEASSNGTETLCWYNSARGETAARHLQRAICECLGTRDRGIIYVCPDKRTEAIIASSGVRADSARAVSFFQRTRMAAIMIEPGFGGSNPGECRLLQDRADALCAAIAQGIAGAVKAIAA